MNETNNQLLASAREYVTSLFTHKVDPKFVFHNLEHTEDVVEACSKMADYYQLSDSDRLVLLLAAWFHDTGHSIGETAGHEAESIKQATAFLNENKVDETTIQRVNSCIEATRMPQSPVSLVEKILCDADLFHLATEDFKARSQLLRQERESLVGHKIDKKEWRKGNINFLSSHAYFTDYGQEFLEAGKQENLNLLKKKKLEKGEPEPEREGDFPYIPLSKQGKEDLKTQQKNTERGIQTMFRTAANNHIRLSSMADSKSHIMISVNSIIISVVLTITVRSSSSTTASSSYYLQQFLYPIGILLLICLLSMVFSILATRPSVTGGRFTEDDIRNKKTNLLFFGNFYRMQLEDYQWAMNQMIKDADYLYDSMIKDIYFLGVVLAKKYHYLRISYTIFMWGLIVSVIAFALAAVIGLSTHSAPLIDY